MNLHMLKSFMVKYQGTLAAELIVLTKYIVTTWTVI